VLLLLTIGSEVLHFSAGRSSRRRERAVPIVDQ
jgi:hypothetical protein